MNIEEARSHILEELKNKLPDNIFYHDVAHTLDVHRAAIELADMENVTGEDLDLLKVAAMYHDCGYTRQYAEHERVSCDIAKERLPKFGFSQEQIDKICGMIMATRIPQEPHNLLEQIICDADLDYLGRDDYAPIAEKLRREFVENGMELSQMGWVELQIKFMGGHKYWTKSARNLREKKKSENLQQIIDSAKA